MIRVVFFCIAYCISISVSAQSIKESKQKALSPFAPVTLLDNISGHNETYELITQEFPENNDCRVEAAEQIIVPSGQTWSITEISMLLAPHSGISKVKVSAYSRSPMGTPGFPVYDEIVTMTPTVGPYVSVALSEQMSLFSGIYFISVSPIVDGSMGNIILTHADASSGEQIYIRDPCNIVNGGSAWVRVGESLAYGDVQMHDLAISLTGVSCSQYEFVSGDLPSSNIYRATIGIASDAVLPSEESTIIFESKKDIDILPGFTVPHLSSFIANIKECSHQPYGS